MADILVVDDDRSIATAFRHFLRDEGHEARFASHADDALARIAERRPILVFMDVRMPGVDGLEALARIRARFPDVPVVVMTAWGTSQTSIDAIRAGAFDYLTKPLDLDELRSVIAKVAAAARVREAAGTAVGEAAGEAADARRPALVGESPAMAAVYKMIGRLATNDVPALILGERGTGRHLVCATIHDNSPRRDQRFLSIACEALPPEAIEAALFGSEGGTVALANVEALPAAIQARLAEALREDRANAAGRLTVRVLASTTTDLADRVRQGAFRGDLGDALSVITLRLPPLRDRREDVPLLVQHFVQRYNERLHRTITGVDHRVSKLLREHAWPGNVGQLERVVKRACIVAKSDVITADDLGDSLDAGSFDGHEDVDGAVSRAARAALQARLVGVARAPSSSSPFHDVVEIVEATLVAEALSITNGNQVKASELLGVNRATLRKKARREES